MVLLGDLTVLISNAKLNFEFKWLAIPSDIITRITGVISMAGLATARQGYQAISINLVNQSNLFTPLHLQPA